MLFHSAAFLFFFALFIPFFILSKGASRLWLTVIASNIFYAWWNPSYLIILWGFTLLAYSASTFVGQLSPKKLALLIAATLLPLCIFKYAGFLLGGWIDLPKWPLPLGISFITFTVIAYWMDIRRGLYPAEKNFGSVALYISFFPHLIAGPIMRPRELFPQFAHLKINPKLIKLGLFLFSVGLIKKVFFADILSPAVSRAYESGPPLDAYQALLAFYAFPVQIYCDFSGYTDMALGIAFILGIRLPLNFNRPYTSISLRDFWRRWHITLSRWLRDYLYIPLGGNRAGKHRMMAALILTMTLGGLWHGAAWTFVAWGAYHGALLIIERSSFFQNLGSQLKTPLFVRRIFIFHLVAIGWVLFRARTWEQVVQFFYSFGSAPAASSLASSYFLVALMAAFFILHRYDKVSIWCWLVRRQKEALVYGICAVIIILSAALSVGNPNAFIYFDF